VQATEAIVVTTTELDRARADFDLELVWPTRVLIVDDAPSTRHFLRAVLEYCPQFEVAGEAGDGSSAIEMAVVLQPDVVLLDLSMPGRDGSSTLGGLLQAAPSCRVIILSGTDEHRAGPLLAAGATAFVPKGLAPFELIARLGTILGLPVVVERKGVPNVEAPPSEAGTTIVRVQPTAVVCDDDTMARRLVAEVLDGCGVSVIAETDVVPSLLAVIELVMPELVVLDLWLEGTTGASAIPEIRKRSPGTQVVVYSAHEDWKEDALACGATAFVAKPNFDVLGAAIHWLIPSASP
jgi:DNA-binding NarL/FixJ family response regulator